LTLGQNRKPAIDELDVNPINKERGFAELNERAETGLRKAPAAPGVGSNENHEEEAGAHEEEIGIRMPVIVDGVEADCGFVEEFGECAGGNAEQGEEDEGERVAAFCKIGVQEETDGKADKGESGPRKKRKEPGLRCVEDVDAIYVGLKRPGKEPWAKGGPERRRQHGEDCGGDESREDRTDTGDGKRCTGREITEDAHEHHGNAEDVEDVDAEQVGPGRVTYCQREFLNAEEKAEADNFRAAKDGLFGDGAAVDSLLAQTVGDECEGNSSEKDEKRRGKSSEKLRPDENK